jgi:hypothetical protein
MGASGTSIFANDVACDVRGHYRELIEDGVDDAEATRKTIDKYQKWFDDPESGTAALVGFAVTQSKIGRLDPSVRDRAIALIDRGGDLDLWARDSPKDLGKRKAALEKARAQLTGPQPARKRLKPPRRVVCDLVAGDVLAFDLPGGPALVRVVYVQSGGRYGELPTLEELEFDGPVVPSAEIIQQIPARIEDFRVSEFRPNARFTVMLDAKNAGWKEAGFRKVANIPARAGDEVLGDSGRGTFWSHLARLYRRGDRMHRRSD